MTKLSVDVVVPTVGRPSLARMLDAIVSGTGRPEGSRIFLVDDRRAPSDPLLAPAAALSTGHDVQVINGGGRGPAAARNAGWKASAARWIAFLDDDVVPPPDWWELLLADLATAEADPRVAASQGRLRVPLPHDRRPTDWERNVAGLEGARWATADMAYRRSVLLEVGGFDERFPRAYREDADLGLRVIGAGSSIVLGRRTTTHPVGPASPWVSVRLQAGNRDDALMSALHGPGWREAAGAGRGRIGRHLLTTAGGIAGVLALVSRRRRPALLGLGMWAAGTIELALTRIRPGPRTPREIAIMALTSLALPPAATAHRGIGLVRSRRPGHSPGVRASAGSRPPRALPAAVLLDRDGTLVEDVPYNADPARVRPMPGARRALDRLRAAGVPLAVVSNQSGVARGLITPDQLEAVNRRVEELLGPLGPWLICPHGPEQHCGCRKPAAGLVRAAAESLGVDPTACVLIGDIGADVEAARAAGARSVLVPTALTRPEEVGSADVVAANLEAAVDSILGGRR